MEELADAKDQVLAAVLDSKTTLSASHVIGISIGADASDGDATVSVLLTANAASSAESALAAAADNLGVYIADIFNKDAAGSGDGGVELAVTPAVSVVSDTLGALGFEAVTFVINGVNPSFLTADGIEDLKGDVVNAVASTSSGVSSSDVFGVDVSSVGSAGTRVTVVVKARAFGTLSTKVAEDVRASLDESLLRVTVDGAEFVPTSIATISKGGGDETLVFTFPDVQARSLDVSAEVQIEDALVDVLLDVGADPLAADDVVGVDVRSDGNGGMVIIVPLAAGIDAAAVADGFKASTAAHGGGRTLTVDGVSETPVNIVAASSFGTERDGIQLAIPGINPSAQSGDDLLSFEAQLVAFVEAIGGVPDDAVLGVEFKADSDNNLVAIVALDPGVGKSLAATVATALQEAIDAGTLLLEKGEKSFLPAAAELVDFDGAAASASMVPAEYVVYDPFAFNLWSSMVYYISLSDLSGANARDDADNAARLQRQRRFVPDSQLVSEFQIEFAKLMVSMQISQYTVGFLGGRAGFNTTIKGLNQFQRADLWDARCTMCIDVQRYVLCPVLGANDQALFDAVATTAAATTTPPTTEPAGEAEAQEVVEPGDKACETRLMEPSLASTLDASVGNDATAAALSGGTTAAVVVGVIAALALIVGYAVLQHKKKHNGGNKVGVEKEGALPPKFVPDKPDSPTPRASPKKGRKASMLPGSDAGKDGGLVSAPSGGKALPRKLGSIAGAGTGPLARRLSGLGALPPPMPEGATNPRAGALGGAPPAFGGFGSLGGLVGNTLTPTASRSGGGQGQVPLMPSPRGLATLSALLPPSGGGIASGGLKSLGLSSQGMPRAPGGMPPPPGGGGAGPESQRRLELRPIKMPAKRPSALPGVRVGAVNGAPGGGAGHVGGPGPLDVLRNNPTARKPNAAPPPKQLDAYNRPAGLAKPKLGAAGGVPGRKVSTSGLAKLASSPFGAAPGVNTFMGGLSPATPAKGRGKGVPKPSI